MAETNYTAMPPCPRCAGADVTIVARSPVAGVWLMFLCPTCFYSWRSTEPDYAVRREAMAKDFHIDPASIAGGRVMPEIPPLRAASADSGQQG